VSARTSRAGAACDDNFDGIEGNMLAWAVSVTTADDADGADANAGFGFGQSE
jgi:hypothetical protein